jgi:hypothetical protein
MSTVSVKERDFLDQDDEIRYQKYACVSFVSPEDTLANKDAFAVKKFVTHFSNEMTELFENLSSKFSYDTSVVDMIINIKDRYDYLFKDDAIQQEYKLFRELNESEIDNEFMEKNDFQTCIRGIKIRGVYENLPDAQNRAKKIRSFDDKFDIFICEVGCWCPWSPVSSDIENQEYTETQLNTLMKKYKENMNKRDEFYKERFQDLLTRNKEENKEELIEIIDKTDPWMQSKEENASNAL